MNHFPSFFLKMIYLCFGTDGVHISTCSGEGLPLLVVFRRLQKLLRRHHCAAHRWRGCMCVFCGLLRIRAAAATSSVRIGIPALCLFTMYSSSEGERIERSGLLLSLPLSCYDIPVLMDMYIIPSNHVPVGSPSPQHSLRTQWC